MTVVTYYNDLDPLYASFPRWWSVVHDMEERVEGVGDSAKEPVDDMMYLVMEP